MSGIAARTVSKTPTVLHPGFSKRFNEAADLHPHCPPKEQGRLRWIADEMAKRQQPVSVETVRKWLEGIVMPRQAKGEVLAEVMQVDPAWLLIGVDVDATPRERKVRNAMAEGVVNLIAGFIAMDGGHPAFPDDNDRAAERDSVDIYAIIKGGKYSINVTLGEEDGAEAQFVVPVRHENVIVLGVLRQGFAAEVFEITGEQIETYGSRRAGSVTMKLPRAELRKIDSFSERL